MFSRKIHRNLRGMCFSRRGRWSAQSVEKREILFYPKDISWNQLFSNFHKIFVKKVWERISAIFTHFGAYTNEKFENSLLLWIWLNGKLREIEFSYFLFFKVAFTKKILKCILLYYNFSWNWFHRKIREIEFYNLLESWVVFTEKLVKLNFHHSCFHEKILEIVHVCNFSRNWFHRKIPEIEF